MRRAIAFSVLALAAAFGQEFKLGSKVTGFNVQDLNGGSASFSSLRGAVTVVTFVSVRCPVSNAYNERMNAVYRDYSAKGVKFIFVNANSNESASDVREHAKSVGFAFPVYKDPNNELADRFNAQVTPESYVIDESGVIRYHGQIDDSQNESRVSARRLRAALDALLAGNPVTAQETKAFGCSIKRARRSS
jgi:peroxiredoxin